MVTGVRVAATILYVPDVAAALVFDGRAFGLEASFAAPDGSYATLAGDGPALAFASVDMAPAAAGAPGRPAGFEVWIEAPDVSAALAQALAAGAEPVQDPVTKPWGQVVAYVRDPNGTLIELGTPVSS